MLLATLEISCTPLLNVFQGSENILSPKEGQWKFFLGGGGGGRGSKSQLSFKGKYEAEWEFPGRWGVQTNKCWKTT